jgi:XTP/dITP diphosphohydrolase
MQRVVIATNNAHKVAEIRALLPAGYPLITLQQIGCTEALPEEHDTLEGNSYQKAAYVFEKYGTPCLADDSGLEVEALAGEPGVHSAHYAGPRRSHADNMQLLLQKLAGVAARQAHFRTVITLVGAGPVKQFEGVLEGTIATAPRGHQGFGYDPVFIPQGSPRTLAEMTLEEKNNISHRARAVEKLVAWLTSDRSDS